MILLRSLIVVILATSIGLGVMALGGDNTPLRGDISVLMLCGLLAYGINWLAFIPAAVAQTEKYYDITGTITYVSVTVFACLMTDSLTLQGMVVAAMVLVWALRLGTFLFARIKADGFDRRFNEIKVNPARFFVAWTLQGTWVTLTAACAFFMITATDGSSLAGSSLGPAFYLGAALWFIGFGFEVVADRQKKAFRSDPANKDRFIQSGLWSLCRHPNYFGEIVLWTGIAVMALPYLSGTAWVLLISPVFVYVLLTRISGIPMLAAHGQKKWGDDPAYQAYLASTPPLFPKLFPNQASNDNNTTGAEDKTPAE